MRHFYYVLLVFFCFLMIAPRGWTHALPAKISSPTRDPKISLNFNQIPVRQLLELLAQERHLNLIISDSVKGEMTLQVENLPWSKILDIIRQQQGLVVHYVGNIMIVNSMHEWVQQQTQQFQAQQTLQDTEPLQMLVFHLRYGKAAEIREMLKNSGANLLSTRGTITTDTRTNSLWIQDIPEKLHPLHLMLQQLDLPMQQILIEARVVSLDEKYERELGIRFGITRPGNQLSGSLNGANALAQQTPPAAINPLQRLNVDLPAVATNAGRIGLALVTLGGGNLLDLELSALASEGNGEIISSPQLMTEDRQPASILAGQEIPYQQAAGNGATSISFQKAVLNLTVTPQIVSHQQILLTLQLNQDHPTTTLIHGVPAIDTRQIQTHVLLNNGQTVVLGGIYEEKQEHQRERIPFLSDLPLVGNWFQHDLNRQHRRELLIFITPTIVYNNDFSVKSNST